MGFIRRTRIVMFPENDVVWGCCTKGTKTVSRVWVLWWGERFVLKQKSIEQFM